MDKQEKGRTESSRRERRGTAEISGKNKRIAASREKPLLNSTRDPPGLGGTKARLQSCVHRRAGALPDRGPSAARLPGAGDGTGRGEGPDGPPSGAGTGG